MKIEYKNVTKKIKNVCVLNDINITFESGTVYGIKGKNGCGKTMFLRSLCGLIGITKGTISIDGKILGKDISFPESIGILIENPSFIDNMNAFDNLKILTKLRKNIDNNEILRVLKAVNLEDDQKKSYKKFSLGMKQKLGIAAAVMGKPDIVLLDEPINALDENSVRYIRNIIDDLKNNGSVVVVVCHDKDELELLSDKIYQMADGRIFT